MRSKCRIIKLEYLLIVVFIVLICLFLNLSSFKLKIQGRQTTTALNMDSLPKKTCEQLPFERKIKLWHEKNQMILDREPMPRLKRYGDGRLFQCRVPKSAQAIVDYIYSYLTNETGCDLRKGMGKLDWGDCIEAHIEVYPRKFNFTWEKFSYFAVIREPISRFLSGWLDKCLSRHIRSWCYRCEEDLECFVHANYRSLIKWNNKSIGDLDFPSQDHFFPWNWLCGPTVPFKIKYIKFERTAKMYENLEAALREDGVSEEKLSVIHQALTTSRTDHVTFGSKQFTEALELLSNRPDIYDMIIKTYYYDYKALDFFPLYPTFEEWKENNEEMRAKHNIKLSVNTSVVRA